MLNVQWCIIKNSFSGISRPGPVAKRFNTCCFELVSSGYAVGSIPDEGKSFGQCMGSVASQNPDL